MSRIALPEVDINEVTPEELSFLRGEALAASIDDIADRAEAQDWSDTRFDEALAAMYRRIDRHFDDISVAARKARKAAQRELVAA